MAIIHVPLTKYGDEFINRGPSGLVYTVSSQSSLVDKCLFISVVHYPLSGTEKAVVALSTGAGTVKRMYRDEMTAGNIAVDLFRFYDFSAGNQDIAITFTKTSDVEVSVHMFANVAADDDSAFIVESQRGGSATEASGFRTSPPKHFTPYNGDTACLSRIIRRTSAVSVVTYYNFDDAGRINQSGTDNLGFLHRITYAGIATANASVSSGAAKAGPCFGSFTASEFLSYSCNFVSRSFNQTKDISKGLALEFIDEREKHLERMAEQAEAEKSDSEIKEVELLARYEAEQIARMEQEAEAERQRIASMVEKGRLLNILRGR